jgi:hypothetical protein
MRPHPAPSREGPPIAPVLPVHRDLSPAPEEKEAPRPRAHGPEFRLLPAIPRR